MWRRHRGVLKDGSCGCQLGLRGPGPLYVEGRVHGFLDGVEVALGLGLSLLSGLASAGNFGELVVVARALFEHLGDRLIDVPGDQAGEPPINDRENAVPGYEERTRVASVTWVLAR